MSTYYESSSSLFAFDEVERAITLFTEPGQVFEIRALEASFQGHSHYTQTLAGYFDNVSDLRKAIASIQRAKGIYLTLQPCHPELLHRACNKLIFQKKDLSTPDKYITRYRWLFIDSDPERPSGISSTDEEHELALAHSQTIRGALRTQGWPEPIWADSGNGSHLHYAVDLAMEDTDLMRRVLEGLAEQFDQPGVHVDKALYNPSRICKLYGTLVCKGDNTAKRPHRFSRLLDVPETMRQVPRELLKVSATPEQTTRSNSSKSKASKKEKQASNPLNETTFNLTNWIAAHNIETYGPEAYQGGTRWELKTCAWNPSHTKGAVLIQFASGAISASCRHESCYGKKWEDFRIIYEPEAYTKQEETDSTEEAANNARGSHSKEEMQALQLVNIVLTEGELFTTPAGERYARLPVNGHDEVVPITERGAFRHWLLNRYYTAYCFIPSSTALLSAINLLESRTQYGQDIKQNEVFLRVAEQEECLYLDLGNANYEAVEITSHGWRIVSHPPVRFRRSNSMLPLPRPVPGGTLGELKPFLNVADEDWILVKAWLLGTFLPRGPYAILSLHGEHGTSKSTATRVLRALIDPAKAPLRKQPNDDQAFAIMANNNYVIAFDNLSYISEHLSDQLCSLATGAGDAYRTLYSNHDETIFEACRPQIFNGIEELATRGDLIDRCIIIKLQPIPSEQRRDEKQYWQDFGVAQPRILGALLDAVVLALRNRPHTKLASLPRMADFALWVQAAEPALTDHPGSFLKAYQSNRNQGISLELEDSPVGSAILILMQKQSLWLGSATDLKKHLDLLIAGKVIRHKSWPGNGRALSSSIKRLAPSLRAQGITTEIGYDGTTHHRYIRIEKLRESQETQNPQPTSESSVKGTQAEEVCVTGSDLAAGQSTDSVTQVTQNYPSLIGENHKQKYRWT